MKFSNPFRCLKKSVTPVVTNKSDDLSLPEYLRLAHEAQISSSPPTSSSLETCLIPTKSENTKIEISTNRHTKPSSSTKKSNHTVSFNEVNELQMIPTSVARNEFGQKISFIKPSC